MRYGNIISFIFYFIENFKLKNLRFTYVIWTQNKMLVIVTYLDDHCKATLSFTNIGDTVSHRFWILEEEAFHTNLSFRVFVGIILSGFNFVQDVCTKGWTHAQKVQYILQQPSYFSFCIEELFSDYLYRSLEQNSQCFSYWPTNFNKKKFKTIFISINFWLSKSK